MSSLAIHYETFSAYSPNMTAGPYRVSDYLALAEGEPVELIRGRLVMTPSPSSLHQIVVAMLYKRLLASEADSGGLTIFAPMDVFLADDTVLQPDLLYLAAGQRQQLADDGVHGPPSLVVEVVSGAGNRRDRVEKLSLYAKYGVPEYWIVDPVSEHIEFLVCDAGKYVVQAAVDDQYQSPRLPEIVLPLDAFWRDVRERLPRSK